MVKLFDNEGEFDMVPARGSCGFCAGLLGGLFLLFPPLPNPWRL